MESKITTKGQATIPKAIRQHLGLKPGSTVRFFIHPNGSVVMLPTLPISASRGMLAWYGKPVTLEEMEAGIRAGATRSMRRVRKAAAAR